VKIINSEDYQVVLTVVNALKEQSEALNLLLDKLDQISISYQENLRAEFNQTYQYIEDIRHYLWNFKSIAEKNQIMAHRMEQIYVAQL